MGRLFKLLDPFIVFLVSAVALASLLPARGQFADLCGLLTDFAIGVLFFLNGAKLSRQSILAGIGHWRMHLLVLSSTFILFPILGLFMRWAAAPIAHEAILAGVVYLCLLPSTVQSSIAFTAIAGGNLPAAICSATISNVLGVFITPVLVSIFLNAHGDMGSAGAADAVKSILIQLLAPFIAGHLCRPLLARFMDRHKKLVSIVDRGSIIMVVYTAFSRRDRGYLAQAIRRGPGRRHGHQYDHSTDRGRHNHVDGQNRRLQPRGPHLAGVLRQQKEPGFRGAYGRGVVSRPDGRRDHPAPDALPPDPAHALRRVGASLCG
jgi:predicted Na+-dependent transporter